MTESTAAAEAQQLFYRQLGQQDAVAQQQATNLLRLAFVARAVALLDQAGLAAGSEAIARLVADFNHVLAQVQAVPSAAGPAPPPSSDARSPAMPLNEEVVNAVNSGNVKAAGEQPAMLDNLAYANLVANTNLAQQNAVAHQQAMNELGIAVVAKAVDTVTNLGPLEARSAVDALSNNELAQTVADLKAAVQAFTQPADNKP